MKNDMLATFATTCGVAEPFKLTVTHDRDSEKESISFRQPFILFGRSRHSDVNLSGERVSRRHAYLQFIEGSLFCVDLKSRTGTHWHGAKKPSGWVFPGDSIKIGSYSICVSGPLATGLKNSLDTVNPLVSHSAGRDDLVTPSLEFLDSVIKGSQNRLWELNRRLTLVGQSSACKVRFDDPSVSYFHCSLLRTSPGVWVIDLLGRGGISVNGQKTRFALLEEGDVVRVGKFRFRVHYHQDVESTTSLIVSLQARQTDSHKAFANTDAEKPPLPKREESLSDPEMIVDYHSNQFVNVSAPSEDTMPAPAGGLPVPVVPDQSPPNREMLETAFAPMFQNFSLMQQQMFGQFQQTILMIVQTFSELYKDQAGLIREELDRLHDLNRELIAVQTELAKHQQTSNGQPATQPPSRPAPLPGGQTISFLGAAENQIEEIQALPEIPFLPSEQLGDRSVKAESTETILERAVEKTDGKAADAISDSDRPASEEVGNENQNPAAFSETPADEPVEDVHNWLINRMQTLEKERQNSWQRITGFLFRR